MKLEQAKKYQKVSKLNLNEIVKGKGQKSKKVLQNIKMLHKTQEADIKLFNDEKVLLNY